MSTMSTIGGEINRLRAKMVALMQHEQFIRDHKLPVHLTADSYLEWKRRIDEYVTKFREMQEAINNLDTRSEFCCQC